ncbi:MAG: homoserine kinase [Cyclobacteriaceae bacterium]|jgi:homoserine kinase|nr:homoserine kinase [Cyclobacteriaceae bacterium]
MKNYARAFAPATVANVSCGFDVFGFALEHPGDEVELWLNDSGEVNIRAITGDGGLLPRDAGANTCSVAVQHLLHSLNIKTGVDIVLHKKLPLGSGMGSSAASAAAALVAVNHALGEPLKRNELLPFAMEAERIACGSAHADNAAPAIMGGFVLIRNKDTLDIIDIPVPEELHAVVIHPHIEIKTSDARQAMKKTLSLTDAVKQWGNTAALVAALMKSDYDLIGRSMEDVVAEPVRSLFIPGFAVIKQAALDAGALGCGISGSGPSMFAFCRGNSIAQQVSDKMLEGFASVKLQADSYVSPVNKEGARIMPS